MRRNGPSWCRCAFAISVLAAPWFTGCSTSDATTVGNSTSTRPSLRAGDSDIVPIEAVPETHRPRSSAGDVLKFAETTYADGNPTHYADGSPAYLPNGKPIDYRPRNIQRELHTMSRFFVRDVGQPRLGFEGSESSPTLEYLSFTPEASVDMPGDPNYVWTDPATGDLCWRALTCTHAECVAQSEEPLIFAASMPGFGGTREESSSLENALAARRCPRCGRADNIENYDPPATVHREQELKAELESVRAERQRD